MWLSCFLVRLNFRKITLKSDIYSTDPQNPAVHPSGPSGPSGTGGPNHLGELRAGDQCIDPHPGSWRQRSRWTMEGSVVVTVVIWKNNKDKDEDEDLELRAVSRLTIQLTKSTEMAEFWTTGATLFLGKHQWFPVFPDDTHSPNLHDWKFPIFASHWTQSPISKTDLWYYMEVSWNGGTLK